MQPRSDTNLWAIDVSNHQGDIDWATTRVAGVQFALIKASEGVGMTDGKFRRNAGGAAAVGMPAGYYHYSHPELNDVRDEIDHFLSVVASQPAKCYALDVEGAAGSVEPGELTDWVVTWCREVRRRTGKPVLIYSGAYFARDNLTAAAGEFPLWIAHYGLPYAPLQNKTWSNWSVWQVSDNGGCPGMPAGTCDTNLMEADFYWELTKGDYPADPVPQPELPKVDPLDPGDANKIILFLSAAFGATEDPEAKEEFHRLADELRKKSLQNV